MSQMRIWGYGATFGWAVLAFLIGQFVALVTMLGWAQTNLHALVVTPYDGALITLFLFISNPITVAVLVIAVWLKRADVVSYLALHWTRLRYLTIGLIGIVVLIGGTDTLLFLNGRALVTPFQLDAYRSAAAEGWLAAMLVATIIVAPAGEEIMFRGFLFRGFARSERSTWPAIIVISVLWAGLHVQYDWTGILQIFVVGLFFGWMRWRSGSVLLTLVLHALFNLEGTVETMLQIKFFS